MPISLDQLRDPPAKGTCRLIGCEISLYSGKARAYLRRRGIPFEEVLSTRAVVAGFVAPRTGLRMVPVVQFDDGRVVQDTTAIIDAFEFGDPRVYPADPVRRFIALVLEVYGDEWLLMPAMHYRWAYKRENMALVLSEFGELVAPTLPRAMQIGAGLALAAYFGGGYGPYLGIDRKTRPAIETSYLALLDDFETHLQAHDFLLGDRPTIGDFGFIAPFYAHLYRDPAPGKLLRERAPNVALWVERTTDPDRQKHALDRPLDEDDETGVPATVLPLLRRFFTEFSSILRDTMAAVPTWLAAHPDAEVLPRTVGRHSFSIDGATGTRVIQPFTQWMWQRPLHAYQALQGDARVQADQLLEQVGGLDLLQHSPEVWLKRRRNRLIPHKEGAPDGPGGALSPAPPEIDPGAWPPPG